MSITCEGPTIQFLLWLGCLGLLCAVAYYCGWVSREIKAHDDEFRLDRARDLADEWDTDVEVTGIQQSDDLRTFIADLRATIGQST